MTDSSYAHVVILADRSGSMAEVPDAGPGAPLSNTPTKATLATEGVRQLIASQAAAPGRTTFTLVQFTTGNIETIAEFAPGSHPELATWKCMPADGTPLLDAIGSTITATGEKLAAMPEGARPGRVYFAVSTDGKENDSREHTLAGVKSMITHQREAYGWEFLFLGAGIDAFADARAYGIPLGGTLDISSAKLDAAYASAGEAIIRSRAGGQSVSYTDAERKSAGGS